MPTEPGPASADALSALAVYLDGLDDGTRGRGRAYFKKGAVRSLASAGPEVRAVVRGSFDYDVRLTWADGDWFSACTCPLEMDCKHVYATGQAWMRQSDRAVGSGLAAKVLLPPVIHPGEAPLVAEFTAATGQPPDRRQLAFLRNLQAVHRSLGNLNYGWFDRGALVNLASAQDRHLLQSDYANPFNGWWPRAPATPLQLWPFIALLFTERGLALPAFTAPFDHLDRARETRATVQREAELRAWRARFAELDRLAAAPPAPANAQALRLRLGAKKISWELSPTGADGAFAPLPANALRELLRDEVHCAQVMDEASHVLLTFLRANLNRRGRAALALGDEEDRTLLGRLLAHPQARARVVGAAGEPISDEPGFLTWRIDDHPSDPARALVRLAFADGAPPPAPLHHLPGNPALFLHGSKLYRGLPPLSDPAAKAAPDHAVAVPRQALALPEAGRFAARTGLKLPGNVTDRFRAEPLQARLRAQIAPRRDNRNDEVLVVELHALAAGAARRARWQPDGWNTKAPGLDPAADAAFLLHDYAPLQPAADHLARWPGLRWDGWAPGGGRFAAETTGPAFADHFAAWLAGVPAGILVELGPELAAFAAAPIRAHFTLEVAEGSGIDWFDVNVQLAVEDTTLTAAEIKLLRSANGRFIRLQGRGWRRLELAVTPEEQARFERLGLDPAALDTAAREAPRFHALQLADEALGDALPEKLWRQIRDRAAAIRQIPAPALPIGLRAEMRPYQLEGFHFLAHLAENHFGGVLADDMGLGKTLQALAWLLGLAERPAAEGRPFRALVVCPKSVVVNWQLETERFAPALTTGRLLPRTARPVPAGVRLVIVNYAQLRLNAELLAAESWDAVVLDEGQNIKNPASATAQAARALRAARRVVLTGTPIENRLLDLWSLFAFAQPGLLGGRTAFKRLYNDRAEPAAAHARLATRVRHFLLRRTKGQVARDLPPRTEEDLVVELDGPQRALYDAELKRARQLLLGVKTAREFDTQRFNILQSLLRLRQICCDPRLVGAELAAERKTRRKPAAPAEDEPARKAPASAKLEALLDTLEPLLAEGHRVLVFSQFVTMLELIRAELVARGIAHLLLTGQTENRQELVNRFQAADGPPVFLLSLKAAGSGLNLTAASYVVLYDPWWNPAVEAQAIDRTHRIGQTSHVIAYRLLARGTVEEKIRALQKEKAALAAAVVQEESLARVLDLESLRQILG
ncbi:MAG: DEAD/DEAH box helicase [Opitutae bacterium]|nr:DEAD/DEAH box helicase [Opitutae bacterium]